MTNEAAKIVIDILKLSQSDKSEITQFMIKELFSDFGKLKDENMEQRAILRTIEKLNKDKTISILLESNEVE